MTMRMKFRSKPCEVEAERFDGTPHPDVSFGTPDPEKYPHLVGKHWCGTLEGPHEVTVGDWIVTGLVGEKYPVKPHIFEKRWEQVRADAAG